MRIRYPSWKLSLPLILAALVGVIGPVTLLAEAGSGASDALAEVAMAPPVDWEAHQAEAWEVYRAWKASGEGPVPSTLRSHIDRLWDLGRRAPEGSPAVAAKGEALHLLVHIRDLESLESRIGTLAPTDPTWDRVVQLMAELAGLYGEGELVERVLRPRATVLEDPQARARLWLVIGDAWGEEHRSDAERAYRQAIDEDPGSQAARSARGNLYELAELGQGAPAPAFTAATLSGGTVRSEDLVGRAVILDVWASW